MTILEKIVMEKRKEISKYEERSTKYEDGRKRFSLKEYLMRSDKNGIIAEFKRRSPGKGLINDQVDVNEVAKGYMAAGASGISVLTDEKFFGGSIQDLDAARQVEIPLLRKDFIIHESQLMESAGHGADVILLIAACLSAGEIKNLTALAHELGMEVLLEIHGVQELEKFHPSVDLVGVNNRNLDSFEVHVQTSIDLAPFLPKDAVWVSESGISRPETIVSLKQLGYKGFLMGERFMKEADPAQALHDFAIRLKALE